MSKLMKFFLGEQKETVARKKTAAIAGERLQIILAHQRGDEQSGQPYYLPALQRDMLEAILKHIPIKPDDLHFNIEREGTLEILEWKLELPGNPGHKSNDTVSLRLRGSPGTPAQVLHPRS